MFVYLFLLKDGRVIFVVGEIQLAGIIHLVLLYPLFEEAVKKKLSVFQSLGLHRLDQTTITFWGSIM